MEGKLYDTGRTFDPAAKCKPFVAEGGGGGTGRHQTGHIPLGGGRRPSVKPKPGRAEPRIWGVAGGIDADGHGGCGPYESVGTGNGRTKETSVQQTNSFLHCHIRALYRRLHLGGGDALPKFSKADDCI